MISTPCKFEFISNSWTCRVCGYTHSKPSRRPPTRKCEQLRDITPKTKRQRQPRLLHRKSSTPRHIPTPKILLGDRLEQALTKVGVTKDRVEKWIGRPCKCGKRQEKMNNLDLWVRSVLSGKTEDAEERLDEIIDP